MPYFDGTIAKMFKKERQAFILHQVNLHNKVICTDLCLQMKVSDDTVRRDLQELAIDGKIIKVHGGALSPSFHHPPVVSNDIYSHEKKKTIAEKAIALIKDGMFVLTSGGTTIIELARSLPPDLNATFISCSLPAVLEYANHPRCEVIMIGDKVSKASKFSVGMEAIARIRQFKCDLCIMGINAIDPVNGISDNDWEVVQVKKAMIESTKNLVCLTISEKINTQQPISVCRLDRIDTLITELSPDDAVLKPYIDSGITVF